MYDPPGRVEGGALAGRPAAPSACRTRRLREPWSVQRAKRLRPQQLPQECRQLRSLGPAQRGEQLLFVRDVVDDGFVHVASANPTTSVASPPSPIAMSRGSAAPAQNFEVAACDFLMSVASFLSTRGA